MAVFVLTAVLFAGCGGKEDKKEDTAPTTSKVADAGIFSTDDVTFISDDGEALYRVIRPAVTGDELKNATTDIYRAANSNFKASMKNVTDNNEETGIKEILVGNTNRKESEEAREYLKITAGGKKDDFLIGSMENKIVIIGTTEEATVNAVKYFLENYFKEKSVAGGILYVHKTEGEFRVAKILGHDPGEYVIIRPHLNFSYLAEAELEKLAKISEDEYGFVIDICHDNVAPVSDCEIIIGLANREGCEYISDKDAYKISIAGSKVYINGGSPHALAVGVTEFANMLKAGDITEASSKTGIYSEAIAGYDKSTYYTYKWGDDFDGAELDKSKWLAFGGTGGSSNGTYDHRPMYRSNTPESVWLSDGKLYMAARYDDTAFYGTMLSTASTMQFRYGYAEMSCIIADGDAFWSAFWINNDEGTVEKGFRGEIDVYECFGNSSSFASNCHVWPTPEMINTGYKHTSLDGRDELNARQKMCPDGRKFNDELHTIGCLWTPTHYSFTCDGDIFFTYDFSEDYASCNAYSEFSYIYYSIFTGAEGNLTRAPEECPGEQWQETNKCICDYLNIYQLDDGQSAIKILK